MNVIHGYLTVHAKSSAAVASLFIHAVLLVTSLSFVAVSTYIKEDQVFVPLEVRRARMPLRKLTVPVKMMKRTAQKPKLRQTMVLKKEVKLKEIKMPEIAGINGGTGYLNGGGMGGIDFDLGEIEFFGIRGSGQRVVFIIDYSESMQGEKEAIMRREASRIITELPKGTQFSVIFFAGPAWPAASNLESKLYNWVKTGNAARSFRPKDWDDLPKVRYKAATKGACLSMVTYIKTTPLAYGTVYDCPIYMALSMKPIPDTIFFMTDGQCSEDRGIIPLRIMVDQLKAAGERIPVMHTIGFGISRNRQLEKMAELMGGESNFLTIDDHIFKYGPTKSQPGRLKTKVHVNMYVESVPGDRYPIEFSLR